MVLFSEFVVETGARWLFGYVYIGMTGSCIAINLIIISIIVFRKIKDILRSRKHKKEAAKMTAKVHSLKDDGI